MATARIKLPPKLVPLFANPRGSLMFRGMFGGRGSGKSRAAAKMATIFGYADRLRILCAREFQASIRESMHAELRLAIESEPWLAAHYDVGVDYIRGRNGTEFIFRGLRHNDQSVKSLANIDLTIVEEAEDVPEGSWLTLEATVFRQPKSELWAIWNPRTQGSPVDLRFRQTPRPRSQVVEINWRDNPFFPEGMKALREAEETRLDPGVYTHVWEGSYLTQSEALVFNGRFRVGEFTPGPGWDGPYFGADFGFAQDPTTLVKAWLYGDQVFIEAESGKVGLDIDKTGDLWRRDIPEATGFAIRGDSARPETISYLRRFGFPKILGVEKWKGSVEDGVEWLRTKGLVIHPRCRGTIQEARLYSYRRNKAGDILPEIDDANNHYLDALRYAMAPHIKRRAGTAMKELSL